MLIVRMTQESDTTYKVGVLVEEDRYDDVTHLGAKARAVCDAYIAKTGYDGSSGSEVIALPSEPVNVGYGYPRRFRNQAEGEEIKWKTT